MDRTAFARAWKFLGYRPGAKWTAILAAVAAGVLYVAFLFVFGLFADLMVTRGNVPAHRDLAPPEHARFQEEWDALTPAERR